MSKNKIRKSGSMFEMRVMYAVHGAYYEAFGLRLFNTQLASLRDASPQFLNALSS